MGRRAPSDLAQRVSSPSPHTDPERVDRPRTRGQEDVTPQASSSETLGVSDPVSRLKHLSHHLFFQD